jgi:homoserine O-acetyltransferase
MDPLSYKVITEVMDSHDLGRNRGGVAAALGSVKMPMHVIGIDSDVLYPLGEQHELMELLPDESSSFTLVQSDNGHDGFLLEQVGLPSRHTTTANTTASTTNTIYTY